MKISQDGKLLLSTLIVLTGVVSISWIAMGEAQHAILRRDAESTALHWAKFLQRNLTGLDGLLKAGLVTQADRVTFDFASDAGGVLHYQVFTKDGTVAFSSRSGDSLTTSSRPEIVEAIRHNRILTGLTARAGAGGETAIAEAFVPLRSPAGHAGALKVGVDVTKRAADLDRIRIFAFLGLFGLLLAFCGACGLFIWRNIRNRRWAEELQRSRNVALEQLATGMPLEHVLSTLVSSVERLKPDTICSVQLLDETGRRLRCAAGPSLPDFYRAAIDGLEIGPGVDSCGTAAFTGELVVVEDLMANPSRPEFRDVARKAGLRSCWSQPIFSADRKILGTLVMFGREPSKPTEADLEFVRTISHLIGIAVEQRRFQAKIAEMAHYDSITGLINRHALQDRLRQYVDEARALKTDIAFAIVDVDRFKTINDTYGRPVGDAVIKEMARRLTECIRGSDIVGRLDGDEFAVILRQARDMDEIKEITARISKSISVPMEIGGKTISASVSIGVSCFPRHAGDADDLFVKADRALYQAKQKGRRTCEIYDEELHGVIREKQALEQDVAAGIARGEFCLVYQPQIDLRNGRLVGFEALARWNHPVLGPIAPDRFIPIVEASALIAELGDRLLGQACAQASQWRSEGLTDIRIAVNAAPRQFNDPHFVEKVKAHLDEAAFDPAALEIEITESLLIEDFEGVEQKLRSLNKLGVSISIDDFGTGYASLLYVTRLPFQSLKIDRSFISNLPGNSDSVAVVSSILALARRLNLSAVAEGVETAEQVKFLRANGCRIGQGFLFARPMEPQDVLYWYRTEYLKTIYQEIFAAEEAPQSAGIVQLGVRDRAGG